MSISQQRTDELVQQALSIRQQAYSPYSNFLVGAAVMGVDGKIYSGCNVENASYGLTICAERGAVMSMVAAGCRGIAAIAIALSDQGTPCGACRQVLTEFGRDYPVFLVDASTGTIQATWNIDQLLPAAFRMQASNSPLHRDDHQSMSSR